jgi:hypothetical protein
MAGTDVAGERLAIVSEATSDVNPVETATGVATPAEWVEMALLADSVLEFVAGFFSAVLEKAVVVLAGGRVTNSSVRVPSADNFTAWFSFPLPFSVF